MMKVVLILCTTHIKMNFEKYTQTADLVEVLRIMYHQTNVHLIGGTNNVPLAKFNI